MIKVILIAVASLGWIVPAFAVQPSPADARTAITTLRASSPFDAQRRSAAPFAVAPAVRAPAPLKLLGTVREGGEWVALVQDPNKPDGQALRAKTGTELTQGSVLEVTAHCVLVKQGDVKDRFCLFED
jgi:hypothetical protein